MWEWLEGTSVALWVGESSLAYPLMLSLHAIGLAIIVGIFVILDLRLLGSFKTIRVEAFLPLMKLAWVGFIINAISGLFLFSSQASIFVTSTPFLLKIAMIVVGVVLAAVIQAKLRQSAASKTPLSGSTVILAIASISAWLGAIVTGRLIAYV